MCCSYFENGKRRGMPKTFCLDYQPKFNLSEPFYENCTWLLQFHAVFLENLFRYSFPVAKEWQLKVIVHWLDCQFENETCKEPTARYDS